VDKPLNSAIALDLGTTSIKAALLDQHGNLTNITSRPAPTINESDGCYESDALCYVDTAERALQECHAQTDNNPPLGLCSQRSSFLIWDKTSGMPVTPLISWQDNRGKHCYDHIQSAEGAEDLIRKHTGLRLTPYYFAPKLSVLLQDNPTWREKLEKAEWLVGTLDTFLIWRWTQGQHFCTDASMAARTLLMDIHQQQWSASLCDLFKIPASILAKIKSSTDLNIPLNNGLTLQASVGDQSAALIASVNKNTEALINLGTGGFVIRYLAKKKSSTINGYLQTLIYQDNNHHPQIAIEGTLNSIAAALAPYPVNECRFEDLATNDIFCLAEPSGLGAPYFRNDWGIHFSRSITHLTTHQTTALLLEAIIFRVSRILQEFHHQSPIEKAYLSGGLSELNCLQQGIAQCAPCPIYHSNQKETSLQGAALLAAGNKTKYQSQAQEIKIEFRKNSLSEKYQYWKDWLDALLKHN
jgi:glycerol kinase